MRAFVADLLACPVCRRSPLSLTILESSDTRGAGDRTCELTCGVRGHALERADDVCSSCSAVDVETGYLFCDGCERFYFVLDGIPRLLTEDFGELLDLSLPGRFPDAFRGREPELEKFLAAASDGEPHDSGSEWNLEDITFWEDVYADSDETELVLRQAAKGRTDAGNRTYARERALFRRLRGELPGGVMLDLGCGLAQTVRTACHPDEVGYLYIGADLAVSALRTNRQTLSGEFIQCTADRIPFRSDCVDAVLMLGTLHHLADHDASLEAAMRTVRPGGWIALNEVVARHGVTRRVRQMVGLRKESESAHNESVDPAAIERCLGRGAETVVSRREFSPLRGILVRFLGEPMRSRPWLTKLVLGLDAVFLRTVGRLSPIFEGRELLVLARKHASTQPASSRLDSAALR